MHQKGKILGIISLEVCLEFIKKYPKKRGKKQKEMPIHASQIKFYKMIPCINILIVDNTY